MKIKILQGPIHSGKTTYLKQFILNHNNCAGILSPVINDKRYFLNIRNSEMRFMEAESDETEIFEIGRFKFSIAAFQWAIEVLLNSYEDMPDYLIIDEIGPLELQGKGFAETLSFLLRLPDVNTNLILVIREAAVDAVIEKFGIERKNIAFMHVE
jgi:nucleoside-triphosphatase